MQLVQNTVPLRRPVAARSSMSCHTESARKRRGMKSGTYIVKLGIIFW
jgi:hypothetical protein